MSFCHVFNSLEEACDKFMSTDECKKCENCIYENGISTCQRMKNYIENGGDKYENQ